jgi:hypothetical protein
MCQEPADAVHSMLNRCSVIVKAHARRGVDDLRQAGGLISQDTRLRMRHAVFALFTTLPTLPTLPTESRDLRGAIRHAQSLCPLQMCAAPARLVSPGCIRQSTCRRSRTPLSPATRACSCHRHALPGPVADERIPCAGRSRPAQPLRATHAQPPATKTAAYACEDEQERAETLGESDEHGRAQDISRRVCTYGHRPAVSDLIEQRDGAPVSWL